MTALDVQGRRVEVSNPEKLFFPDAGITKGDVVEYYRRVADQMLPYLRHRPLALHRHPDGIAGHGFFQKEVPDHFPDWIDTVTLEKRGGGTTTYVVCDDAATLVYLADQAALVLHILLARVDRSERPDQLVLDLDPPNDDEQYIRTVQDAAAFLRAALEDVGLTPYVKSSGSRGLHVHVFLDRRVGFDEARALAADVAQVAADESPDSLTVAHRRNRRGGRVFIDVGRNAYGQHAVAPYALRARPEAPVAVPLDWQEALDSGFHPRRYTIENVFRRLGRKRDPWAEATAKRGSVAAARRQLAKLDKPA